MNRWTEEQAQQWYQAQPWLVGCNFIPSTAINQLEMWQTETWDPDTTHRELGWAARVGLNAVRVFLHDLAYKIDPAGFKQRFADFLEIAAKLDIRVMPVFFDDCWHSDPRPGVQPVPRPGIHNSAWVQSPGSRVVSNRNEWKHLQAYMQDILSDFASDPRILLWDLYNEPGNRFLPAMSLPAPRKQVNLLVCYLQMMLRSPSMALLEEAFRWARAAQPSQPLSVAHWFPWPKLDTYLLGVVDVITFHNYNDASNLAKQIALLQPYGRPILCTEYLARSRGSNFATHLPIFKQARVGCFHWGLVSGKTQTIYTWQDRGGKGEPATWYHDLLRSDGTPHRSEELELIQELTHE